MVSDNPITNQDGVAWKVMYKMKPSPVQKKQKKNDLISVSLWKNGRSFLFWNHISLKNTLKTKQNWQYWIYCLQLFCLQQQSLYLCHGNCKVIYLYSPFTITSFSWQNNRGNIKVKPFPPSNDQVNSAFVLQTACAHSHVCPHTAMLLMKST